jgi:hypothetical protein
MSEILSDLLMLIEGNDEMNGMTLTIILAITITMIDCH